MGKVKLKLKDTGGAGLRTCGVSFKRDRYGKAIPTELDEAHLEYVMAKYGHKLVKHRLGDDGGSRKKRVPVPVVAQPDIGSRAERRAALNREIEAENVASDDADSEEEEISSTPAKPKKAGKKKPAKKKGKKKVAAKKKTASSEPDAAAGEAQVGGAPA